jgi:hypothetical protein
MGWVLGLLACGCVQAPAAEEDLPRPWQYGIRVLAASPRQDFRNLVHRTGLGAGLFVETEVGSGWIAQTRFDYVDYPQVANPGTSAITPYAPAAPLRLNVNAASLGADLRHPLPFEGWAGRFYGQAGLMGIRYEYETASANTVLDQYGNPLPGVVRTKNKTSVKVGMDVGVGVEIVRGLDLAERFTTVNIDGFTLGNWETSLSYRF